MVSTINISLFMTLQLSFFCVGDSLSEVFAKDVDWRVLGVLLGLSDSALENIQSTSSSEEDRQQEMVKCWISTECAYWSVLVDQLKGPVLNKRTLATSLAKTHLGKKICCKVW